MRMSAHRPSGWEATTKLVSGLSAGSLFLRSSTADTMIVDLAPGLNLCLHLSKIRQRGKNGNDSLEIMTLRTSEFFAVIRCLCGSAQSGSRHKRKKPPFAAPGADAGSPVADGGFPGLWWSGPMAIDSSWVFSAEPTRRVNLSRVNFSLCSIYMKCIQET